MKLILHNFLTTLKRFKTANLLNILGLSIAFATFIIILMQVNYERGFDKFHSKADRIYRLENAGFPDGAGFAAVNSRRDIDEFILSSPHIEAGAMLYPYCRESHFSKEVNPEIWFQGNFVPCTPEIARIFDFDMVEGDTSALRYPDRVLIPQSTARKVFGNEAALGRLIHAGEQPFGSDYTDFTVGGVYRDFPGNSQVHNWMYIRINDTQKGKWYRNFSTYILLDSPDNRDAVIDNYMRNYVTGSTAEKKPTAYRLNLLSDIYYTTGVDFDDEGLHGNRDMTRTLILIALLIVMIASINFTNFSTAMAPMRIKSINTQKVLGSPVGVLRRSLIFEATCIALIAYLISLAIVSFVLRSGFTELISVNPSLQDQVPLLLFCGGIALAIGSLAGAYPAWYLTSFQSALVLKGSFGLSPQGRKLRTILISVQFVISIVLIAATLIIRLQNHYMQSSSLGFDKENIALVPLSQKIIKQNGTRYTDKLLQYPEIEAVAFANERLCGTTDYSISNSDFHGTTQGFGTVHVSYNFLDVMDIPVIEGRNFTASQHPGPPVVAQSSQSAKPSKTAAVSARPFIFNRRAAEQFEFSLGDQITAWGGPTEIIGVMENIHSGSLQHQIAPLAFIGYRNPVSLPISYVRIRSHTDLGKTVSQIKSVVHELDPEWPFQIEFFDRNIDTLYQRETRLGKLITLFSLLALFISVIGVFGLVVFDTQYRRREIGVRKVFGATIGQILLMFNKSYIRILSVCCVIALPIAYYFVHRYLEGFAYKTPIPLWIFVTALSIVLAVTVLTVTLQSYRAATENPANSIKTE